jgi:hypothetical protein
MKTWFEVLGRSCLEFLLLLIIGSFLAGAADSLAAGATNAGVLFAYAVRAVHPLLPIAAAATLFLSFFGFERRVRSRVAGWAGILLLGVLLFSVGLVLRRMPFFLDAIAPAPPAAAVGKLQAPGLATKRGKVMLWYRTADGPTARDAAAVDFGAAFPRLAFAGAAQFNDAGGEIEIGGRRYDALAPGPDNAPFLPETRLFEGHWIWERLAGLDGSSLIFAAAAAAGFVLLAAGFRFFARLTRWPLANAFFALAGFFCLLVLDAALASPAVSSLLSALVGRAGLRGPAATPVLFVATAEAILGLVLGAIDLAIAPPERRARG